MIDFAGQTVTILGRLAALPNRVAVAEIGRRGGVARRALAQQTTWVAVGRHAVPQLADGRLQAKLARADQLGALCLSENALLRALDLLPPAAPVAAAVRLDELGDKTGLGPELVRLLVLFDVIQPDVDGALGFRDLIAAREVGRLLAEGVELAVIIEGTAAAAGRRSAPDDHPLARLKLVCDDSGQLARRIEGRLAELDGQLRLPLANPGNPSVDEVFEDAEHAEQAGDLAAAEALYRRCVGLDRSDPIAPFNLANVLREQGRHSEAKSYLQLALAIDPKFADAWYNLALLVDGEGRKDLARTYLERASAADPRLCRPALQSRPAALRGGRACGRRPALAALPGARPRQRVEPARPPRPGALPAGRPGGGLVKPRLDDQVERRFGRAPDVPEPGLFEHARELLSARLRAEHMGAVLGDGMRAAQGGRGRVVQPSDRVDVVFDAVAGERLDQHDGAAIGERARGVCGGVDRAAHVVQAVEEADQVVAMHGIGVRARRSRTSPGRRRRPPPPLALPPRSSLRGRRSPRTGVREGLRHQHGRMAVAATDVRDPGAGPELVARPHPRRAATR